MFTLIKTGLKSTWRNEKAKSMTCNLSKFILVLEHLKIIKFFLIASHNWKTYQLTLFGGENILRTFFSCIVFSRQIIFYNIKLTLSISNKFNYDVTLSKKFFKR